MDFFCSLRLALRWSSRSRWSRVSVSSSACAMAAESAPRFANICKSAKAAASGVLPFLTLDSKASAANMGSFSAVVLLKEGRASDWEADWSSRKTVLNVFSWYELPFNIGRMRQNVSSKASSLERTFSHVFRKFSCAAIKSASGRLKTKYGRLTNFCIAASMVCGVWRRWNTSFAKTG